MQEANAALAELRQTQRAVAERLELHPNTLNRILNEPPPLLPRAWRSLLTYLVDELGQERLERYPTLKLISDPDERVGK